MERFLILFVLVLTFSSCDKFPNYRGTLIEYETALSIEVENAPINRGILMLNNKYFIETNTPLVYLDTLLNFEKYRSDEHRLSLKETKRNKFDNFVLSDISPKYHLIKEKNSNIFFVIKNQDTLAFKLIDRNAIDPDDPTIKEYIERLLKRD